MDFEFFRACVQNVFATPREGHIKCSNCHGAGQIGFAPLPGDGRTQWNEEEARQAFRVIARLIVAGNPVQSRFLLKPLHPDGGGSYATMDRDAGRAAMTPSGRCWQHGSAASARATAARERGVSGRGSDESGLKQAGGQTLADATSDLCARD